MGRRVNAELGVQFKQAMPRFAARSGALPPRPPPLISTKQIQIRQKFPETWIFAVAKTRSLQSVLNSLSIRASVHLEQDAREYNYGVV